jgi:hypothetical protein
MPEALFEQLYTVTRDVPPVPLEQIQARGWQRARRQRLVVVAAVWVSIIVVSVTTVALARPYGHNGSASETSSASPSASTEAGPSTSASPSTASPSPAAASSSAPLGSVPSAAMLQPVDVGVSPAKVVDNPDEGDWDIKDSLWNCPAYRTDWLRRQPNTQPIDRRLRNIAALTGEVKLTQEVGLYRSGDASTVFTEFRNGALMCARHKQDGTGIDVRITIVAEGFVGTRSMLVRVSSANSSRMFGFVMVGNLLTEFTVQAGTEQTGRRLAGKARDRMCAAIGSC